MKAEAGKARDPPGRESRKSGWAPCRAPGGPTRMRTPVSADEKVNFDDPNPVIKIYLF